MPQSDAELTAEQEARVETGVRWSLGVKLGSRFPLVILAAVTLSLVVLLLVSIGVVAFQQTEGATSSGYTLQNFRDVYTDSFAYKSLRNTLGFGFITVITALLIGTPMAWLAVRTNLPGRGAIFPIMTLGLVVPSFFTPPRGGS